METTRAQTRNRPKFGNTLIPPLKPGPRTGLAAAFGPEARKSGSGAGAPSSGKEPRREAACPIGRITGAPTQLSLNRTETKKGHTRQRYALLNNLKTATVTDFSVPALSKTSSLRTPLQSASTLKPVGIHGLKPSDQPRTYSAGREQRTFSTSSRTSCRSGA